MRHALVRHQHVVDDIRETFQVAQHDLQQIVGVAGERIGFLDIVDPIDQRAKPLGVVGRMGRQRDVNECDDVEAERFAGEVGVIARYHVLFLQPHALFKLMGYEQVARHKTRKITVYRQGDINYIVNEASGTHGFNFVAAHGPCAPSMAFRVVDAQEAYQRALLLGAEPADIPSARKTLDVPAIKGIGGSLLYFVDRYGAKGSAYDAEVN